VGWRQAILFAGYQKSVPVLRKLGRRKGLQAREFLRKMAESRAGGRAELVTGDQWEMRQEIRRAAPNLSGVSEELSFGKDPAALVPGVEAVLKDAGIHLVRTGESEAGPWLLGKSLADREVLVQILPVYPGRSRIRLEVQGGDPLTRELLKHLSDGVIARYR
jgi:hypothetical protein